MPRGAGGSEGEHDGTHVADEHERRGDAVAIVRQVMKRHDEAVFARLPDGQDDLLTRHGAPQEWRRGQLGVV